MKTKLFPLLMILLLSASLTIAQNADNAKMSFGVLGGVNFQNLNGTESDGYKLNYDMLLGFHVGANVQIPIAPEFFFQPGLLLSTKGAKDKRISSTITTKITYLELPLNFVYKGLLGNGYVMVGFGPYFGFGIGGKEITESSSPTTEEKIKFKSVVNPNDPDLVYFKAFDAGANIFAGYVMASGIFVQLNTQFGMLKINPENTDSPGDKASYKNTGFGLSIGYRL